MNTPELFNQQADLHTETRFKIFWEIKTELGAGRFKSVASCYRTLTHAVTHNKPVSRCNSWASFVTTHVRCQLNSSHTNVCGGSAQRSRQPRLQVYGSAQTAGAIQYPSASASVEQSSFSLADKRRMDSKMETASHRREQTPRDPSVRLLQFQFSQQGLELSFFQTEVESKMQTSNCMKVK